MTKSIDVKLLRDKKGQYINIPPEFEFSDEDVLMSKDGERLILRAAPKKQERESG
jgi:virulence-associated protein VagC